MIGSATIHALPASAVWQAGKRRCGAASRNLGTGGEHDRSAGVMLFSISSLQEFHRDAAARRCRRHRRRHVGARHERALVRGEEERRRGEFLGVNHSTVLRRVPNWRNGWRAQFEKLPTGYRLTDAGEEVLGFAVRMEASSTQLETRVFGRDQGVLRAAARGTIQIPRVTATDDAPTNCRSTKAMPAQRPGRSSRASRPAATLMPTWPCTLIGCSAIVLLEPPTSTLPPTPTPSVALPCAPA